MHSSFCRLLPAVAILAILAVIVIQPRPGAAQGPGMDHPIVQAGLSKLGGHGGQCYVFAANAVREATGMVIGRGYRQGYLDAGGVEVNPDNARAGDVLQISNRNNHSQFYPGMHTVIVIENLGNRTYRVIDSNRNWDERVTIHTWTPRPAAPLQLYAYRFDNGSSGGPSTPNPTPAPPPANPGPAPELAVGSSAVVDAGDSCLRLRGAAGTDKTILNCLTAGSTVTVLSEPTQANGYTWLRVRTASGQEGWVAAQFLSAASAAEPPAEPETPSTTPEPTEPTDPPPAATPEPEAPTEGASGVGAVGAVLAVDTGGSCLYLRGASGLSGDIMDCMGDGTTVTVIGGPVEADGYTWLNVETASGVKGWSAQEFLVPAE